VEVGAAWYTYSQDGKTALIHAAYSGDADFVRLLVDAGADKEFQEKARGLYHCCMFCKMVLFLLILNYHF
jgi:hypothetical protein